MCVAYFMLIILVGYWIWSFQGKILKRINLDSFAQLLWRPRPMTLLSAEHQKEIKKNLKKYYAQFESKDRMRQSKASKELIEKRASLMQKFNSYRQKRIEEYDSQKPRRLTLRNSKFLIILKRIQFNDNIILFFFCLDVDTETDRNELDTENFEEEIVEFFIKEEITIID